MSDTPNDTTEPAVEIIIHTNPPADLAICCSITQGNRLVYVKWFQYPFNQLGAILDQITKSGLERHKVMNHQVYFTGYLSEKIALNIPALLTGANSNA